MAPSAFRIQCTARELLRPLRFSSVDLGDKSADLGRVRATVLMWIGCAGWALCARPEPAQACSPPLPCERSEVWIGGTIPANAPGFFVALGFDPLGGGDADAAELRVTGDDGVPLPVTVTDDGIARFDEALNPGDSFTVELDRPACQDPEQQPIVRRVTVGPAAPFPERLGTLSVRQRLQGIASVPVSCGLCFDDIDAVDKEVQLDAATEVGPWQQLLRFSNSSGSRILVRALCAEQTSQGCQTFGTRGRTETTVRSSARIPRQEGFEVLRSDPLFVVADCAGPEAEQAPDQQMDPAPDDDDAGELGGGDLAGADAGCRGVSGGGGSLWLLLAGALELRRRSRLRP